MKYVKSYRIYESSYEERKSEIMEILRDCEDLGFRIRIIPEQVAAMVIIDGLEIRTQIQFKDIRSNVEHLISYMKSEGYNNFIYSDSISDFNKLGRREIESNVLPPDDNSRESFVSVAKITFRK